MNKASLTVDLASNLDELGRLARVADEYAQAQHLPAEVVHALRLGLEEIVSNVIRHGGADGKPHRIEARFDRAGNELTITVADDAPAFDPLARPPVDVSLPIDERPIGGLGIHLVRNLMDEVHYQRAQDRNILTMKKRWP